MEKQYTRSQYFNSIKSTTIRGRLFKNADPDGLNLKQEDILSAIYGAFVFAESPEGIDYWENIVDKVTASKLVLMPIRLS